MKTAKEIIEPLIFPDELVIETLGEDIRFVSANDAINAMEKYAKAYHESRMKEIPEITNEGNLLFNEMGEFSVKTFTGATAKGHLRKLKEEADEAIEDPTDIKEYADCLMALFGAAYKAGFTYDSLIQAGKEKLEINKSRKWVKLENEIYQHVIENGTEKNNVKE